MAVIGYAAFGKLRLSQFLIGEMVAEETDNWEFMDQVWVGELLGFTEWLRLKSDPEVLRSISVDIATLPKRVSAAILDRLGMPLSPGMKLRDIITIFGEPTKRESTGGRTSYHFTVGEGEPYLICCTMARENGLSYLVIMRTDFAMPNWMKT
jgi:hypothetical protein